MEGFWDKILIVRDKGYKVYYISYYDGKDNKFY